MEQMKSRAESFNSLTDPKLLALTEAKTQLIEELKKKGESLQGSIKDFTEEDIRQEWQKEINDLQFSVFGIVTNERIKYFGSVRDESKQKIVSDNGTGLAKKILKALGEEVPEDAKLSIDQVTNELVISSKGEAPLRIQGEGGDKIV